MSPPLAIGIDVGRDQDRGRVGDGDGRGRGGRSRGDRPPRGRRCGDRADRGGGDTPGGASVGARSRAWASARRAMWTRPRAWFATRSIWAGPKCRWSRRCGSQTGDRFPVWVENDANVHALGEHIFGAARGVDNFCGHRHRLRAGRRRHGAWPVGGGRQLYRGGVGPSVVGPGRAALRVRAARLCGDGRLRSRPGQDRARTADPG